MSQKKTCKCKGTVCGQGAPECCASCPCKQLEFDKVEGKLKPYSGVPVLIRKIKFKDDYEFEILNTEYYCLTDSSDWSMHAVPVLEKLCAGVWKFAEVPHDAYMSDVLSVSEPFEGELCLDSE